MIYCVIPSYKGEKYINQVISNFIDRVEKIIIVDDCSPISVSSCLDTQYLDDVLVIRNEINLGVGGAFKVGSDYAVRCGAKYILKVDADDQMDPDAFDAIQCLINKDVDFIKGNRYLDLKNIKYIPLKRRFAQIIQSIMFKLSTEEYHIFDVVNGYFAIKAELYSKLALSNISNNFYFETDMLHEVIRQNGKIEEFYNFPIYKDNSSNIKFHRETIIFIAKNIKNFINLKFSKYFVRDFNLGSVLLIGACLNFIVLFSYTFYILFKNIAHNHVATLGESLLFVVIAFTSIQFLISFFIYDLKD